MEVKIKKHGFFSLPLLAEGETDTYCPNCYEIIIFDKPAAAGIVELICPICGNIVYYKKGNIECQK